MKKTLILAIKKATNTVADLLITQHTQPISQAKATNIQPHAIAMKYAKQEKNKCHQTGVGLNDSKTELTVNILPNLVTPQRMQHNRSILCQFFYPSISRISQEVEDGFSF